MPESFASVTCDGENACNSSQWLLSSDSCVEITSSPGAKAPAGIYPYQGASNVQCFYTAGFAPLECKLWDPVAGSFGATCTVSDYCQELDGTNGCAWPDDTEPQCGKACCDIYDENTYQSGQPLTAVDCSACCSSTGTTTEPGVPTTTKKKPYHYGKYSYSM